MTNIYTVSVPLPDRAYDVRIGDGLLERAGKSGFAGAFSVIK